MLRVQSQQPSEMVSRARGYLNGLEWPSDSMNMSSWHIPHEMQHTGFVVPFVGSLLQELHRNGTCTQCTIKNDEYSIVCSVVWREIDKDLFTNCSPSLCKLDSRQCFCSTLCFTSHIISLDNELKMKTNPPKMVTAKKKSDWVWFLFE